MVNKFIGIGRVGKDPVIKGTQGSLATFSMAFSSKGKDGTEYTDWLDFIAFGKTKDLVMQYVKKGKLLYVEGSVRVRKHEDRYYTSISLNKFWMLDKREDGSNEQPNGQPTEAPGNDGGDDGDLW